MVDLVPLAEYLVKGLCKNPDNLFIEQANYGDKIVLDIFVNKDDISHVIGFKGTNASAIRTVIQSSAYSQNVHDVIVNINEYQKSQ